MRVVSLVPSWTETLLECGINVVGRTRYCVHPEDQVKGIPAVGGTKDIDWSKLKDVDLVLFDREENLKEMAESCPFPYFATHIESVEDVAGELRRLNEKLQSRELEVVAGRWDAVLKRNFSTSWQELPGVIEWVRPLSAEPHSVVYLIWRKPWMAASRNTFIGSIFAKLGLEIHLFETKYPEVDLEQFAREKTLLLFSSEPYPFEKKREVIEDLNFPAALVDGECFSWFGVRSLAFLERLPAN